MSYFKTTYAVGNTLFKTESLLKMQSAIRFRKRLLIFVLNCQTLNDQQEGHGEQLPEFDQKCLALESRTLPFNMHEKQEQNKIFQPLTSGRLQHYDMRFHGHHYQYSSKASKITHL